MKFPLIRDWLETRTGLAIASLGDSIFDRHVEMRTIELHLHQEQEYRDLLSRNPTEAQWLIDRLVVPETWFFRNTRLFHELARVYHRFVAAHPQRVFRILSLPCSTGEEPYSLAMTLTEAGSPTTWQLHAEDISQSSIDIARAGRYRTFSFRELPTALRERYFVKTDDDWELLPAIRSLVHFRVANIFDMSHSVSNTSRYDAILCRNVMIYMTAPARERARTILTNLLAEDGCLAVGHAEASAFAGNGYEQIGPDGVFLFQRKVEKVAPPPHAVIPSDTQRLSAQSSTTLARIPTPDLLEEAKRFADLGQLDEAARLCHAATLSTPCANVYCLLGIVMQAQGEMAQSKEAFRRALFLNPVHSEALLHSMLLHRGIGDFSQAEILEKRMLALNLPLEPRAGT